MSNDTTAPVDQSDAGTSSSTDNWEARYGGLQKVLSKRDTELAALAAERDTLKAQIDAESADRQAFEAYRAEQRIAEAERQRRAEFEALKAEFEAEDIPTPRRAAANANVWAERYERKAPRKTEENEVRGFPV